MGEHTHILRLSKRRCTSYHGPTRYNSLSKQAITLCAWYMLSYYTAQTTSRALGDVLARHPGNRTLTDRIISGLTHTLSARQMPRDPEQWLCNFWAHSPPCLPPCQACTESFYATQTMEVRGHYRKRFHTTLHVCYTASSYWSPHTESWY